MALRAGCFSIGELSARSGVKIETLRYYERIGLLPLPPRSGGRHRMYDVGHLSRANFVHRARDLGFSLDQIRDLLGLTRGRPLSCAEVKALTEMHIAGIRRKTKALKKLERTLNDLVAGCVTRPQPSCPLLEALGDCTCSEIVSISNAQA
jgi:MerR family transcriptional regulator, mercuric resistance operon regulatory protein